MPRLADLSLEISASDASPGGQIALAIENDDNSHLGGLQGYVMFDPTRLRFHGQVLNGGSREIMVVNARDTAIGRLRIAVLDPDDVQRTGTLIFDVLAPDYESSLFLQVEEAAINGTPTARAQVEGSPFAAVVNRSLRVGEGQRLTVEDWAQLLQERERSPRFSREPGEIRNGLRFGDTNLDGALTVSDALYLINISVGLNEMIVGTDGTGPLGDRDAVVAGNVYPFNAPGLGELGDAIPPGREADGQSLISVTDGVAIVNEATGTDQPVVGEIIPGRPTVPTTNRVTVDSNITVNTTWTNANIYEVQGAVQITNGATLTIQPGTRIEGQRSPSPGSGGGSIAVQRDGAIVAEGTLLQPIVFTCAGEPRVKGCWGGIIINGNGNINDGSLTSPVITGRATTGGCNEKNGIGSSGLYGGCNDSDSSGILRYIRIEFAGSSGLALRGVGSGTVLDFIQVHASYGDGIEVLGGMPALKHLVLTANSDDSFAYSEGYRGKVQFMVAQHNPLDADKGIEGENLASNHNALPRSTPTFFNVTMIGKPDPSSSAGVPGNNSIAAINIRRGSRPHLFNFLVQNWSSVLDIDDASTCTDFGTSTGFEFTHSIFAANLALADPDGSDPAGCAGGEAAVITGDAASSVVGQSPLLSALDFTVPDWRPAFGSASGGVAPPADGFFDNSATYVGAIPPANSTKSDVPWYSGWTSMSGFAGLANPIPSSVPGFLPLDIETSDSLIFFGTSSVHAHKNLVWVIFHSTASQASRQAALDSIHGVVAGGRPGGPDTDMYFIRIPNSLGVLRAPAVLRGIPAVAGAAPVLFLAGGLTYRKPTDGTGWRSWQLDPGATIPGQVNWQMEALDLPRAWGCSVGSAATKIRVIDSRIHATFGATNVTSLSASHDLLAPVPTLYETWHGDAVTRILAERGDDSLGMTGVMWSADVRQTDVTAYDSLTHLPETDPNTGKTRARLYEITDIIGEAAERDERVINISLEGKIDPTLSFQEINRMAAELAEHVVMGLLAAEKDVERNPSHHVPLVVIAAGNDNGDALLSGLARVAADFQYGKYVLVVTSSRQNSSLLGDSANTGTLVEVAAPGEDVYVIGPDGVNRPIAGTSFAAPAVAGIAGLLVDFDPRLPADSIKQIIIAGAIAGGRTAGGFPVANAYESLKIAARRTGAPLCGQQPVWLQNQQLYVRRQSSGVPEMLASVGHPAWDINVYHGGKAIELDSDNGLGSFMFTPNGWISPASTGTLSPSGSYLSTRGLSHSLTAGISVVLNVNAAADSELVMVHTFDSLSVDSVAVRGFPIHYTDSLEKHVIGRVAAYPQTTNSALVALSRFQYFHLRDSSYVCFTDLGTEHICVASWYVWKPDTTYVFAIDLTSVGSPVVSLVRAIPDTAVYGLSLSESDSTVAAVFGIEQDTIGFNGAQGADAVSYCEIRYYSSGRPVGTPNLSIPTLDACPLIFSQRTGIGTFSPNRAPAWSRRLGPGLRTPSPSGRPLSVPPWASGPLRRTIRLARPPGGDTVATASDDRSPRGLSYLRQP